MKCFSEFVSKSYLAFEDSAKESVESIFGEVDFIDTNECSFITDELKESELEAKIAELASLGFELRARIRVL